MPSGKHRAVTPDAQTMAASISDFPVSRAVKNRKLFFMNYSIYFISSQQRKQMKTVQGGVANIMNINEVLTAPFSTHEVKGLKTNESKKQK